MRLDIKPGKYVVAVSGGVDSMVLLDILARQAKSQKPKAKSSGFKLSAKNFELVVAHFNHGIRPDAARDKQLVKKAAEKYKLPLEVGYGQLGSRASEAAARTARYAFLRQVQKKHRAKAIITAHHQDDLVETALINLIRGTKRRGLSAIAANPDVIRPLLKYPKKHLFQYAKAEGIKWREDITNADLKYLRNYIRQAIMPKMTLGQRADLVKNLNSVAATNRQINKQIATISQIIYQNGQIDRLKFIMLPTEIGQELVSFWLKQLAVGDVDQKTILRLATVLRTGRPDSTHHVKGQRRLRLGQRFAQFS